MTDTPKVTLIREVQKAAQYWDAIASADAAVAVNSAGGDNAEKAMNVARRSAAAAHAAHKLKDDVINLIHKHWPAV